MPAPVMRMAPKPRRLTLISPPTLKLPDFAAFACAMTMLLLLSATRTFRCGSVRLNGGGETPR